MQHSADKPAASLHQRFRTGLVWVLILNLLIKPLWILGIEVGVQNAVGTEAYGFYFSLFNIAYIFNVLLDLGLTNFNTRNIAQHPHLIEKYLSPLLSIKVGLLLFYIVVTLGMGWIAGFRSHAFLLLSILCVNQFLNSLILFLRSNFQALLLFKTDSILSILDRATMIVICGLLLLYSHNTHSVFRIEWFVLSQTVAYIITTIVAGYILLKHHAVSQWWQKKARCSKALTIAIMRQSLPFALLILLMASYNRIDPLLLRNLAANGDTAAGIYAEAFRLLDAITMIVYLVSVPLLPTFARITQQHDANSNELRLLTHESTWLVLLFSIGCAVTLSSLAKPLMALLYTNHICESAQVFKLLIYGIIPISLTYIYGTLLTAAGRLRTLNILAFCTLAINIVINIFLIPKYGTLGSAIASLVAQSFMALLQTIVAIRRYNLMPTMRNTIKVVVSTLIIVIINQICLALHLPWALHLAAMIVLCIALGAITGLFRISKQLIQSKQ